MPQGKMKAVGKSVGMAKGKGSELGWSKTTEGKAWTKERNDKQKAKDVKKYSDSWEPY